MTKFTAPNIREIALDDISIGSDRRPVDQEVVDRLAKSIEEIGFRSVITVRWFRLADPEDLEGPFVLVAGRHRLEAMRQLGRTHIPAEMTEDDEIEGELWEIAENLHRSDLSKEQRDKSIRRYAELLKERELRIVVHSEPVLPERGRGHPKEIARKIAEQTGLSKSTIQRALVPPKPTIRKPVASELTQEEAEAHQFRELMAAWNRAAPIVRKRFLNEINPAAYEDIPTFTIIDGGRS